MFDKVQGQLERRSLDILRSSSSSFVPSRLTDYLLEPQQEILIDVIQESNPHYLLIDYFKASCEACVTCELLLRSVYQARSNNRKIKRAIKLTRDPDRSFHAAFEELSSFSMVRNPLSTISLAEFSRIRQGHGLLLSRLAKKFRKAKRMAKLTKYCKKVAGFSLVLCYSALAATLLVLGIHSAVGIIAAPGLISCTLGLAKKKVTEKFKTSSSLQFEVAAKGIFILINDFDTMSRLAGRLHDEIEQNKAIAGMCVRNGKKEVLMEVVREFRINQPSFREQLEELEEHIYLCFLTINKSRTLVMQEIMALQQPHSKKN